MAAEENVIWEGNPSQILNIWWFVSCILILPIPFAIYKWLQTKNQVYTVTTDRIKYREGIFTRKLDEIELYRVRDYQIEQPFFLRLVGRSNLELATSDQSNPNFVFRAVPNGEWLRDQIREQVERLREEKNVREVDFE